MTTRSEIYTENIHPFPRVSGYKRRSDIKEVDSMEFLLECSVKWPLTHPNIFLEPGWQMLRWKRAANVGVPCQRMKISGRLGVEGHIGEQTLQAEEP